jgi:glycosyltransferase involved in cell wall biosynthesis
MRLVTLPAVRARALETLSHSTIASMHAVWGRRHDVAFVFNSANAVLLPLFVARRIPVALHVDGLEWRRAKWEGMGQRYYRAAESLGVRWADALIADAPGIADYYRDEFGASTELLSYGAPVLRSVSDDRLSALDVAADAFHLVVARFEPENNIDLIVRGFRKSSAQLPLLVIGSAPYNDDYTAAVRQAAASDPRIRLPGAVWDQDLLDQLYAHARLYLHGHSVGGTNPSLLRAMGAGSAVAAHDVRFNRDVLGADPWLFADEGGVARVVEHAEADADGCRRYGATLQAHAAANYRWDDVAAGYAELAGRLAAGASRRREASGRRLGAVVAEAAR